MTKEAEASIAAALEASKDNPFTLLAKARMLAGDGKSTEALALADKVVPAMDAVRDVCDRIEAEVDDSLWPLPKYREMLFVV